MISNEQILQRLKEVPPLVQEAFGSQATAEIITTIGKKYNLHIDVIGVLGREVGLLLLGFIDPVTFLRELMGARISEVDAKTIVTEVNQDIFLPLQKKIQSGEMIHEESFDEDALEEILSSARMAAGRQEAVTIPPQSQVSYNQDTIKIPALPVMQVAPMPLQVEPVHQILQDHSLTPVAPTPVITETPPYNLIRPEVLVAAPRPVMLHSMQADIEALKNPSIHLPMAPASTPAMLHPEHLTPARSFQTGSVPFGGVTSAQPTMQPLQRSTNFSDSIISPSRSASPPASSIQPQQEIVKQYSGDPYREPM